MASEQRPSIGFIGLGIMGAPMVRNLLRAGYRVVVRDVVAAPVEALVAEGAERGESPRDVAARTDVLITMLPDSPQVREVYLGTDGAFEALRPGWLASSVSRFLAALSSSSTTCSTRRSLSITCSRLSHGCRHAMRGPA